MIKHICLHTTSRYIFIICFLSIVFRISGYGCFTQRNDTLFHQIPHKSWYQHRLVEINKTSLPLFAMGLCFYNLDEGVRAFRNSYTPHFYYHYDDFLQYLPSSVAFGLKLSGIRGYSSWKEWTLSNVFGGMTLFSLVNGVKYGVGKLRPDNSSSNSFPSGHTAMAFYGATLLHKEYGSSLSPWISIGGYAAAIGTAMGRILNNRHWISDVLSGAAIGIFSAELGYYLNHVIFSKPHNDGFLVNESEIPSQCKPSFVSLNLGMPWGWQYGKVSSLATVNIHAYHSVEIEAAIFINKHWGVGSFLSLYNGKLEIKPLRNTFVIHSEVSNTNKPPTIRNWKWGVQIWGSVPLVYNTRGFATLSIGGGLITPFSLNYGTAIAPKAILQANITPSFCLFHGLEIGLAKRFNQRWGVKAFAEFFHERLPLLIESKTKKTTKQWLFHHSAMLFSLQPGISLLLFLD